MLPVNSGGHTAYQNFVTENLRKYYPNPDSIARSTWDIIERFCKCDRYFSQPDFDIGWDSSRDYFYHGYDLYMLVYSRSDLPVFPHYSCASKHDSHGFLHAFLGHESLSA